MKRFLPRPLTAFLSTAILPALLSSVMAQDPCKLTDIGTGTVASVRDGRTLLLADGGELRLAAIEVADESRDALQSLVGGRDLRLKQLSPERDRYGRIVAFAYVGNSEQSVQQALLEQGRARVSARTGSKACADLQRAARAARRGLWADPNFAPLRSENLARIAAARGQFALVEGKVLSVRESGATIYLNFGRRWTQDFTVIIPKRHRREFATAGLDPKRLEGNPVRVRGWIGQQSGPVIEVVNPEQIELVE
ncbi:MAG: thermonuclease family protein [Pseudolabrys sp.]